MAPPAYLAPSAQVQIPLKVLYQHARSGAHSPSPPSPLGSETRRASPLHVDRHEAAGIQLAEAARSRALRHPPSKLSHGADFELCESDDELEARSIKLGPSTVGLDYF